MMEKYLKKKRNYVLKKVSIINIISFSQQFQEYYSFRMCMYVFTVYRKKLKTASENGYTFAISQQFFFREINIGFFRYIVPLISIDMIQILFLLSIDNGILSQINT